MTLRVKTALVLILIACAAAMCAAQTVEYKIVATNKTSTTEKEMNEAAREGFRFGGVMGGSTSFGGSEAVTVMYRSPDSDKGRFVYQLLATSKTSTMQRELQKAADEGFEYKGQTVYKSTFGGQEVVVILELDRRATDRKNYEYRLLATKKTSTMEKELAQAGAQGFEFVGITVGETAMAGHELVSILKRARK